MSSAQEITIALSINNAQSASISAAPLPDFEFRRARLGRAKAGISNFKSRELLFTKIDTFQYGVRPSGMIASQGTELSDRPIVNLTNRGRRAASAHRSTQLFSLGSK